MTSLVSEGQLAANGENAKLCGMKTEEGKEGVRFNARRHGILGVLMTDYEQGIYERFHDEIVDEYKPETFMELVLTEQIATQYLRLFRVAKAEREFILTKLQPSAMKHLLSMDEGGYHPTVTHEDVEVLSNIYSRYETAAGNKMYKAMHELERLQRMRRGEHVPAPLAVEVSQNELVS